MGRVQGHRALLWLDALRRCDNSMSENCNNSYPGGRRNETRLKRSLVKQQQALRLAREGCCLVVFVVWTIFMFHLC